MNQNDVDRYFWRTGQHWGRRRRSESPRVPARALGLLIGVFLVTVALLLLQR